MDEAIDLKCRLRNAQLADLIPVLALYRQAVEYMNNQGNYQWDTTYLCPEGIHTDIINNNLLVIADPNNVIIGCASIDCHEPAEYQ
jgi:hypothetical protein